MFRERWQDGEREARLSGREGRRASLLLIPPAAVRHQSSGCSHGRGGASAVVERDRTAPSLRGWRLDLSRGGKLPPCLKEEGEDLL